MSRKSRHCINRDNVIPHNDHNINHIDNTFNLQRIKCFRPHLECHKCRRHPCKCFNIRGKCNVCFREPCDCFVFHCRPKCHPVPPCKCAETDIRIKIVPEKRHQHHHHSTSSVSSMDDSSDLSLFNDSISE